MREHPQDIRDEMHAAADTMRGLGQELSLDDMRYFGERMDYAAMPTQAEMERYYEEEAQAMREAYGYILAIDEKAASYLSDAHLDALNNSLDIG